MRSLKLLPFLAILTFPASANAQYPIIFNHALNISISQELCESKAETAVKRAGFTENFEPIGRGAFGVSGKYSASVRCEADNGIVFFAVAGPDNNTTKRLVVRLKGSFR